MDHKDAQIESYLQSGDNNKIRKAVRLAKSGVSQEVLDLLFCRCFEEGWTDQVFSLAELDISRKARDRLVAAHARKGESDKIFGKALRLAPRGVSQDSIDALAEECMRRGWIQNALETAVLGASVDVANRVIDSAIRGSTGRYLVDTLLKLATLNNRDLTQDEKQSLVTTFIEHGSVEDSSKAAALRGSPLSQDELGKLTDACIECGAIGPALAAVDMRGSPMSIDERSALIGKVLENKKVFLEKEFEELLELAEEGVTQDLADALLEKSIAKNDFNLVTRSMELGASRSAIDSYVDDCIEEKAFGAAFEVAPLGASERKIDSLKRLAVRYSIREGLVKEAISASAFRGKPLDVREEDILMNAFLRKHWHDPGGEEYIQMNTKLANTYIAGHDLNDAIAAAKTASRDSIRFLVEVFSPNGLINAALRRYGKTRRTLSDMEKHDLVTTCIEWGKFDEAIDVAALGVPDSTCRRMIDAFIAQCSVDDVIRLLNVIKKDLTFDENNRLTQKRIERGDILDAFKAARLRGEYLSSQEEKMLAKSFLDYEGVVNSPSVEFNNDQVRQGMRDGDLEEVIYNARYASFDVILALVQAFNERERVRERERGQAADVTVQEPEAIEATGSEPREAPKKWYERLFKS